MTHSLICVCSFLFNDWLPTYPPQSVLYNNQGMLRICDFGALIF